jgi:hypothetical protein
MREKDFEDKEKDCGFFRWGVAHNELDRLKNPHLINLVHHHPVHQHISPTNTPSTFRASVKSSFSNDFHVKGDFYLIFLIVKLLRRSREIILILKRSRAIEIKFELTPKREYNCPTRTLHLYRYIVS